MSLLALILASEAIAAAPSSAPEEHFITSMALRAPDLSRAELRIAQRYASCISLPYFPLPDELSVKQEQCRKLPGIEGSSEALRAVLDSLDSIVRESPGSEASLSVTGRQP
jgi:hypothetical protein